VFSTGILHVNSAYPEIVCGAYAQARRTLLCDFRLTRGPTVIGSFRVEFDKATSDQQSRELPYIVLNVDTLLEELRALRPAPRSIKLRGYYHAPAPTATLPLSQVIMAFARIDKGDGSSVADVTVDLPA
jgi:hypothetical protein